jgi:transcriptional regulator with XRE-family HTH domain
MEKETTSKRLKQLMNERGLRQVDILEKVKPYSKEYNVPISKSNISMYVSGRVEPSQDKLIVLGMALDVSPSWLMGFDVPKEFPTSISGHCEGSKDCAKNQLQILIEEEGNDETFIRRMLTYAKFLKEHPEA